MRAHSRVVLTIGLVVLGLGVVDATPAAAGGGGCHRVAQFGPSDTHGTSVDLADFCMRPAVLRVAPGDTVTFTNRDPAGHNLFGSGIFVGELLPQASVAYRFDDAGTFAYACTLHPGMVGAVVVGDGRRVAPPTVPVLPVAVRSEMDERVAPTIPVEAVPLAATTPISGEDEPAPLVLAAAGLVAAAAIALGVARHRRRSSATTS